MHDLPHVVLNKARANGADEWISELPGLIAALEHDWAIRVGEPFEDATEAFVAEATTADGSRAVLKLVVPSESEAARHEITVLRLCRGEGCAALLCHDVDRRAMLVERLGPSMHALGIPATQRHDLLCMTAQRVWSPVSDVALPDGATKARRLSDWITRAWEELDRPCSEAAVAHALACAQRRTEAHDPARSVLVHGDVHQWNALQAGDAFKLVDPDGLIAEPEYDLGIIMREDPVELLRRDPMERARRLAALSGLDATAIWEWGVVERVSTGLLGTKVGLQPVARQMLETADRLALSV